MDLAAARAVLGVDDDLAWPEVRASYLKLIRRHHPDVAADLADAGVRTLRTAQITQAFAVIVAARPPRGEQAEPSTNGSDPAGNVFRESAVGADDTRTVVLDAPPMEAFLALHEVFSILGAVSYIDRLSLVLETIVVPQPGRASSLLAWLETGTTVTTVVIGVESLGGHPPADLDALVDRIAELLASPRPPVTAA